MAHMLASQREKKARAPQRTCQPNGNTRRRICLQKGVKIPKHFPTLVLLAMPLRGLSSWEPHTRNTHCAWLSRHHCASSAGLIFLSSKGNVVY